MSADGLEIVPISVTLLHKLIRVAEIELMISDMPINVNKSMYRIAPRHNISCADISAYNGAIIPW